MVERDPSALFPMFQTWLAQEEGWPSCSSYSPPSFKRNRNHQLPLERWERVRLEFQPVSKREEGGRALFWLREIRLLCFNHHHHHVTITVAGEAGPCFGLEDPHSVAHTSLFSLQLSPPTDSPVSQQYDTSCTVGQIYL